MNIYFHMRNNHSRDHLKFRYIFEEYKWNFIVSICSATHITKNIALIEYEIKRIKKKLKRLPLDEFSSGLTNKMSHRVGFIQHLSLLVTPIVKYQGYKFVGLSSETKYRSSDKVIIKLWLDRNTRPRRQEITLNNCTILIKQKSLVYFSLVI